MKLTYIPLLQLQRDLYDTARGRARFDEYIRTLRGADGNMELPLANMNPMGKEHLPALLDTYLALDGEKIGEEATAVAANYLAQKGGDGTFRVALVIADDLHGGWTNRYATEFKHLCKTRPYHRRGWLVGHLWSSETPTAERLRATLMTAICRGARITENGYARTLGDLLAQEKAVWQMAHQIGSSLLYPELDRDDLAYTADVLTDYLDAEDQGTMIAALFGDTAARELGYRPLGLSDYAGLSLVQSSREVGTYDLDKDQSGFQPS